jgi:hypothetical protein
MKRINYLVMLAAAALMAGCGPKVEQTVLVGHFHNTDDVPELMGTVPVSTFNLFIIS